MSNVHGLTSQEAFRGGRSSVRQGYSGKPQACAKCGNMTHTSGAWLVAERKQNGGNLVFCTEACFRNRHDHLNYEGPIPWYPAGKSREKIRAGEK